MVVVEDGGCGGRCGGARWNVGLRGAGGAQGERLSAPVWASCGGNTISTVRAGHLLQLRSMASSSSMLVQLQNVATFRRPAVEWTRMLSDCFSPLCWGREEGRSACVNLLILAGMLS